MSAKKIFFVGRNGKRACFKISETADGYAVYEVDPSWLGQDLTKIGESCDFDDALEIASAAMGGPIQHTEIQRW